METLKVNPLTRKVDFEDRKDIITRITAGVFAGIGAGILMEAVLILHSVVNHMELAYHLKLIAATWFGSAALIGGAGTVVSGLVGHLLVSAVFGITYGLCPAVYRSPGWALALGLTYGLLIWV